MNNTKVIKARLYGQKRSGAKIEVMYIKELGDKTHEVLIRGKVKIADKITISDSFHLLVKRLNSDGSRVVEFFNVEKSLDFNELLSYFDTLGHTPLPPYINREDDEKDKEAYQSLFASTPGSVAAPTASLHFDDDLLRDLQHKHQNAFVTLHIGLGTFKNVESDDIRKHQIHSERFFISDEAKRLIDSNKKILCIGTTACRSVEYHHKTKKTSGECDIFLHIDNKPTRVNHLMTNFHLPKSTLIMLVSSFIGLEKTKELYEIAIKNNYRFYSYGDAMLII